MQKIPVEESVGQVLCHDLTRIVKGECKGPQFRKGHVVEPEDIPMLLSMGKEHLYVWEKGPGMLHEDEGALRLGALCQNEYMLPSAEIREGKLELTAACDGLFQVDVERLTQINSIGQLMIATRHTNTPVHQGDKLAGMRVIPLVIAQELLLQAEALVGETPLMCLLPYQPIQAGILTTGSEVAKGLIVDTFTPVIVEKLASYGIQAPWHLTVGDDRDEIAAAIHQLREQGAQMILCTGGMSVDPDDNTPGAIRDSGADIVTYGAPVLPGAMFLLGYYQDGTPVMGLPGCVMYAKATIFDLVLPRVAAGVVLEAKDFAAMGNGGLCLSCPQCVFPNCAFGKGQ